MNIRDYWISKLPEVRKQSPITGRLVESLLINDSKVARETLVEMAKINKPIKLQEKISLEEKNKLEQSVKNDLENLTLRIDKMYKNDNYNDLETIRLKVAEWVRELSRIKYKSYLDIIDYDSYEYKIIVKKINTISEMIEEKEEYSINKIATFNSGRNRSVFLVPSDTILNMLILGVKIQNKYKNKSIINFIIKNLSNAILSIWGVLQFYEGLLSFRKFFSIVKTTLNTIETKVKQKNYDFQ